VCVYVCPALKSHQVCVCVKNAAGVCVCVCVCPVLKSHLALLYFSTTHQVHVFALLLNNVPGTCVRLALFFTSEERTMFVCMCVRVYVCVCVCVCVCLVLKAH